MAAEPEIVYLIGAELPDITIAWNDSSGNLIDFSSGYTFELRIATPTTTVKTAGIVGASTDPNVTISITAGEWDSLPAGVYGAQLQARRNSDNKDRVLPLRFKVLSAIT